MEEVKHNNQSIEEKVEETKPDYILLPGGYKYAPQHLRDPHDPSKPLPR